jgi:hypothetical protein
LTTTRSWSGRMFIDQNLRSSIWFLLLAPAERRYPVDIISTLGR